MKPAPKAAAGSRRYPARPIIGVAGLIIQGEEIALIRRAKPPQQGMWSLPGGAVELGESLSEALRREVFEETGLQVEPIELVTIFERIETNDDGRTEYHYVLIDQLCRVIAGNLAPADDAAEAAWINRAELPRYKITDGTIPVIEKAFAMAAALAI